MNKIKEKREGLGLTIKEVAEQVGVHFTTVSEWELEKITPRPKRRLILAKVLNTTKEELFPDLYSKEKLPKAIFGQPDKPLHIGGKEIQCYVLDNGTRVLTQASFLEAIGRHRKANVRKEGGEEPLPPILQGKSINPFISKELIEKSHPIRFKTERGIVASGYRAEILPMLCEVYLKARDANVLPTNQKHVAVQAEILIRALAQVGIIALVDEATGYQEVRERNELNKILEAYISDELMQWTKRFPDEFYKQMFRVWGWNYPGGNGKGAPKGPRYAGMLTKKLIYEKLPPGVLDEIERKNPPNKKGRRKYKHHQWLTDNIGNPHLEKQVAIVTTLFRISSDKRTFKRNFDKAFPAGPQQEDMFPELEDDLNI